MAIHYLQEKALAHLLRYLCLDADHRAHTETECRLPEVGMVREEGEVILLEVATLHAAVMDQEDLRRKAMVEEAIPVEAEEAIHLQVRWVQLVER
jgi:hypothetical protein